RPQSSLPCQTLHCLATRVQRSLSRPSTFWKQAAMEVLRACLRNEKALRSAHFLRDSRPGLLLRRKILSRTLAAHRPEPAPAGKAAGADRSAKASCAVRSRPANDSASKQQRLLPTADRGRRPSSQMLRIRAVVRAEPLRRVLGRCDL